MKHNIVDITIRFKGIQAAPTYRDAATDSNCRHRDAAVQHVPLMVDKKLQYSAGAAGKSKLIQTSSGGPILKNTVATNTGTAGDDPLFKSKPQFKLKKMHLDV